jgi:N-acetylmuramate 1-kinase
MTQQQQLKQWLLEQLPDRVKSIQALPGDASTRCYYRVLGYKSSYILVNAQAAPESMRSFAVVAQWFIQAGVCVPEIYAADYERGYVLLSDFGDQLLLFALRETTSPLPYYQQALSELHKIQGVDADSHLPHYTVAFMQQELALCHEWYLTRYLGLGLSGAEQAVWDEATGLITTQLSQQSQVCMHRDFQSRNLMLLPQGGIGVIDFQDAMLGPLSYDIVSLLNDCYIDWPVAVVKPLLEQFCAINSLDDLEFQRCFYYSVLQRHLKNLGVFSRLAIRDKRPNYCQHIPRILNYLQEAFAFLPEFAAMQGFFQQRIDGGN